MELETAFIISDRLTIFPFQTLVIRIPPRCLWAAQNCDSGYLDTLGYRSQKKLNKMTPVVESPAPYRHVPISDLFWTGRKKKGKNPVEKPQGRRGAPAAGAGKNILLQAGAGRPRRGGGARRWPVPWELRRRERAGWPPLSYLCRLFFRFLLWFREDLDIFRSLEETSSESAER